MKKLTYLIAGSAVALIIGCGGSNPEPNYNIPPGIGKPDITNKASNQQQGYHIPPGIGKPDVASKVTERQNSYKKIPINNKATLDKISSGKL